MTEFFNFGEHCNHSLCKQKDFLPVTCNLCKKSFCQEHSYYESHECQHFSKWLATTVLPSCAKCNQVITKSFPEESNQIALERHNKTCIALKSNTATTTSTTQKKDPSKCRHQKCREEALTGCKGCGMKFCLSHRYEEDHNCVKLSLAAKLSSAKKTVPVTKQLHQERQRTALAKQLQSIRETPSEPQHKAELKKVFMTPRVLGEKIKFTNAEKNSICPLYRPNMEEEEKKYLKLFFPLKNNLQPVHVYFSKFWSIGRIIDIVADYAPTTIQSQNNSLPRDSEDRLHLYILSSEARNQQALQQLPNSKTLEQLMKEGLLADGDTIILERGKEGSMLNANVLNTLIAVLTRQAIQDQEFQRIVTVLKSCKELPGLDTSSPKISIKV